MLSTVNQKGASYALDGMSIAELYFHSLREGYSIENVMMGTRNRSSIQNLDRKQASALLKRRLTWMGASVGLLMACAWAFVSPFVLETFPRIGSPAFLFFLFLSMLLLGPGGAWLGRRLWQRIVSES